MQIKTNSTPSQYLAFWNWFAVLYNIQALFFLTLIPFNFQPTINSRTLIWGFEPQDIVQNLLLFFPLGVMLQYTLQRSIGLVVLIGTVVSVTVEVIQLFETERTSSYNDIMMNALSTLLGALYYHHFINLNGKANFNFALVYMLIPLCWFIAMRSATQSLMAWLVLPLSMLGLKFYNDVLVDNRLKPLALCLWLLILLLPLVYIDRKIAIFTLFTLKLFNAKFITVNLTPALIILLITLPCCFIKNPPILHALKFQFIVKILLLLCFADMIVNLVWYKNKTLPISWTVPAHLHWIDMLMSWQLFIFVLNWYKQESTLTPYALRQ